MDKRFPAVRSLDGISVGETAFARTVRAVIQSTDAENVQPGLAAIAEATLHEPWTVYRWLRGLTEPSSAVQRRVRAMLPADAA